MPVYTNAIARARIQEANERLTERMSHISGKTGIDFSTLFSRAVNRTAETDDTETIQDIEQDMQEIADSEQPADAPAEAPVSMSWPKGQEAYASLIEKIAGEYGMDPVLISAVIQAESYFDPYAVSSAGAVGLMQLMPATAAGLGVTDSYDPEQNIDGGVRCLLGQIIRFNGDVKMALAAYNCGPYGLKERGVSDLNEPEQWELLPSETQRYLDNITSILSAMGRADLLESNYFS